MPFCGKVASKVVFVEAIVVVVESLLCVEREFELYSIQLKFRLIKFFLPFYRIFHKGVKDRYKKTNNNHTFLWVFIFYFLLMGFLFFIWFCIIYALTTNSPVASSPSAVGYVGLGSIPMLTSATFSSAATSSSGASSYQFIATT